MFASPQVNFTWLERPAIRYPDGIYLIRTTSQTFPNLIYHFGVMIVGSWLGRLGYSDLHPLIFDLIDSGPRRVFCEEFGSIEVLGQVSQRHEPDAIQRLQFAFRRMGNWTIENNCEHRARHVTEGHGQSLQLQTGLLVGGVLAFCILSDN